MLFTHSTYLYLSLSLLLALIRHSLADFGDEILQHISETDEAHEKNKYSAQFNVNNNDWNKYYQAIESAKNNESVCNSIRNDMPCECYVPFIEQQLALWTQSGINEQLIEKTKSSKRGVHYQIINHKLYRQHDCLFPSRCQGVEHFILQVIANLPDMDLIINVHDHPQVYKQWDSLPIFSFSKDLNQHDDIIYPAWSFWSGGPAIDQYPTGIGRWDLMTKHITKYHQDWDQKSPIAFFRGSRTSQDRDALILLSRSNPTSIDAKYTKNQSWRSVKDTLGVEPSPTIPFEDQCKYKYLFNLRGVAASFRYKHLFLCKSLVLNVESPWIEFFYHALIPWKHYVPIKADFSDVKDIVLFLQENDEIAKQIAESGFHHVKNFLTNQIVECYWNHLLLSYARLLKYQVKHNQSFIRIHEK